MTARYIFYTLLTQGCRLRNDIYCVEWDVKLYYTIPYRTILCQGGDIFIGVSQFVCVLAGLRKSSLNRFSENSVER